MTQGRADVWRSLGAPDDQQGSANEPRTREEYGVVWNEKWLYRGDDGRSVERVALFLRSDLVGVFDVGGGRDGDGEAADAVVRASPEN
jgi:hypothetical protein